MKKENLTLHFKKAEILRTNLLSWEKNGEGQQRKIGRIRAGEDFPRKEKAGQEGDEKEGSRCEKTKRIRRRAQGAEEVKGRAGYREARPCNLRRDIAANIGITHCSLAPTLALNPLVLSTQLANGHNPVAPAQGLVWIKGALLSHLIRCSHCIALGLSHQGDSSPTASGS